MKFEDAKPGMVLHAGPGQNFDSLLFVKSKGEADITIEQILLPRDAKMIARIEEPDKISLRDWGDQLSIFYEAVLADESFLRRFVKGVFGIPLRSET